MKNCLTLIKTVSDPDSNGLEDPDLGRPKKEEISCLKSSLMRGGGAFSGA